MVIKLGFYIQPNFILCDGRMKIFLDMPESEKFPSCRAVLWKWLEVVPAEYGTMPGKRRQESPHGGAAQDDSCAADLRALQGFSRTVKKGLTENLMIIHI